MVGTLLITVTSYSNIMIIRSTLMKFNGHIINFTWTKLEVGHYSYVHISCRQLY
jgi:hypothetical protein